MDDQECRGTRRRFLQTAMSLGAAAAMGPHVASISAAAETESQPDYKIGIYTRPWAAYHWRTAMDEVARAGFQYVGLMTTTPEAGRFVLSASTTVDDAAKIGEEARQRGLKIDSVYGGPIPVQQSLAAGIAGMRQLIDACVAAGASSLLMGGIGKQDLYDAYYKAIAESCDYALEKGLPITVKPHGGLNATGPQCRRCLESVGHKNFSLWYDPGNIFFYSYGKLDPVEDSKTVDGLVREGMCIKDFAMVEQDGVETRDVQLTPGTGRVDFAGVLGNLCQGGFRSGHLVIECLARTDGSLPAIRAEAQKARTFVEELIRQV